MSVDMSIVAIGDRVLFRDGRIETVTSISTLEGYSNPFLVGFSITQPMSYTPDGEFWDDEETSEDDIIAINPAHFIGTEVEECVIQRIRDRRDTGRAKYGTTMERDDLDVAAWLQHLQDELLDAAIYAEKLKRDVSP